MKANSKKNSQVFAGASILSAVAASLCCITPLLAFLSGATGLASTFSWMEAARPYFIGITVLMLGFAWYQKLKPRKQETATCACETPPASSFWHSKAFLAIVSLFAIIMLAFPYYASMLYPSKRQQAALPAANNDSLATRSIWLQVEGMSCEGCARHIEEALSEVPGIIKAHADYQKGLVKVEFTPQQVKQAQIKKSIEGSGYQVSGQP
ncbi:mercuric transport protein MerTP [Thermonema rossianum]|uniref:mercuric transport protein MerTP n=1 Tax=Thermonema rossianum TaxID=55505 RepID=UPI00056E6572|nr:mercuric transport protein MerTP [Thermonema rossianum]